MIPLFVAMGIATYLPRALPLVILRRVKLNGRIVRWLGFVPACLLSALAAQAILITDGKLDIAPTNLDMFGAAIALGVAIRTRSLMATVVVGVLATFILRTLFG